MKWVITGCSSGLGELIAKGALERGDTVVVSCRGDASQRLFKLVEMGAIAKSLDITWVPAKLTAFAQEVMQEIGHVDILVNNAGYVQLGAFEETTPEDFLNQFSNLFGTLNLTRAFLPQMRERRAGKIIMIGSQGNFMGFPAIGAYISAKYALAGLTQSLALEVNALGIQVTCVEPGSFRTDVFKGNQKLPVNRIQDYDVSCKYIYDLYGSPGTANEQGDPQKAAERIVDLCRGEKFAAGKKIPTRLALGDDAYENVKIWYGQRLEENEEWKEWSNGTDL